MINNDKTGKEIRTKEMEAIATCCRSYPNFKKYDKKVRNRLIRSIESSILDATIDKSRERNIPTYWDSDEFVEQYSNIGYHVKINIDVESNVNVNKEPKIKNYLISHLCDFVTTSYLFELYTDYRESTIQLPKFNLLDFPPEVFNKILSYVPVVDPKSLGYMNSLGLNPYINQIYVEEIKLRSAQGIKIKYSSMYTCNNCGQKKTLSREIQTCSLDEAGTLFIECIVCGSTWRSYG